MTILKVQFNDEIRRITLDSNCFSLADLEAKVRLMFPQLGSFTVVFRDDDNNLINIKNEEDLHLGCAQANARFPPIFRVLVTETEESPSTTLAHQTEDLEAICTTSSSSSQDEANNHGECSDCSAKFSAIDTRFKCMNCLEVVLCESCESKCVHNPIHLLVKLRKPSNQLSLNQQLIFTSHIEDSKEKVVAKAQNKALRRALREASEESRKKKEERIKARKDRMKRRAVSRCKKVEETREKREKLRLKKAAIVESAEDVPGTLMQVEPFTLLVSSPLEPVRDSRPQREVEEVVKDSLFTEEEVIETAKKADDVETSETVESKVEDSKKQDLTQPWSNLVNSFKMITNSTRGNAEQSPHVPTMNENDYRIQGFSFARKLEELESMGFTDKSKNIVVLMKHFSSLERAIDELTCHSK